MAWRAASLPAPHHVPWPANGWNGTATKTTGNNTVLTRLVHQSPHDLLPMGTQVSYVNIKSKRADFLLDLTQADTSHFVDVQNGLDRATELVHDSAPTKGHLGILGRQRALKNAPMRKYLCFKIKMFHMPFQQFVALSRLI
jgi:hypothetical protein